MAATIPEKFYVTVQFRRDAQEGLLGFASPYTKDKAFEKRKITQDQWAYGSGPNFTIDENDDVTGDFSTPGFARFDAVTLLAGNAYPRIMDNTLVSGFEVSKSVRRCGWSGSGNVVWRITDPRGYDLEISSENFARLVDCVDINKGTIAGKCCWGRDGARNILLPEASDVYQEALEKTTKLNNNITIADVTPGDYIDIFNKAHEGTKVRYLGKYKTLMPVSALGVTVTDLLGKLTARFIIEDAKGKIQVLPTLKVGSIVEKTTEPFDTVAFAKKYNRREIPLVRNSSYMPVLFITTEKVKQNDFSFTLIDNDFVYDPSKGFPLISKESYSRRVKPMIAVIEESRYLTTTNSTYVAGGQEYTDKLAKLDVASLSKGSIERVSTKDNRLSWPPKNTSVLIDVPVEPIKYMTMAIKYKEEIITVDEIGWF